MLHNDYEEIILHLHCQFFTVNSSGQSGVQIVKGLFTKTQQSFTKECSFIAIGMQGKLLMKASYRVLKQCYFK